MPQVVLGEQAGDPGGEVGGVGGDERVVALDEVETLGADRCGDHGRAGHHRLEHLALDAGAVQQGHDGDARPLEVGLHRRHPADEPDPRRGRVDVERHLVEPVADHREGMALEQIGIEQRQDLGAQVLDRFPVREVAEVADEVHALPLLQRVRRPLDLLGQRNREDAALAEEVGEEIALLVGDRDHGVRRVVGVELARRLAPERGVERRALAERPARVAQEVDVDRVDDDAGVGRDLADEREQLGRGFPERDQREIEAVRAQQSLGRAEPGVGGDAHLAEPVRVALLGHSLFFAGEKGDLPAGSEQELHGVVDVLRAAVAVEGRHPRVHHQCPAAAHPRQASTSSWARM